MSSVFQKNFSATFKPKKADRIGVFRKSRTFRLCKVGIIVEGFTFGPFPRDPGKRREVRFGGSALFSEGRKFIFQEKRKGPSQKGRKGLLKMPWDGRQFRPRKDGHSSERPWKKSQKRPSSILPRKTRFFLPFLPFSLSGSASAPHPQRKGVPYLLEIAFSGEGGHSFFLNGWRSFPRKRKRAHRITQA